MRRLIDNRYTRFSVFTALTVTVFIFWVSLLIGVTSLDWIQSKYIQWILKDGVHE